MSVVSAGGLQLYLTLLRIGKYSVVPKVRSTRTLSYSFLTDRPSYVFRDYLYSVYVYNVLTSSE